MSFYTMSALEKFSGSIAWWSYHSTSASAVFPVAAESDIYIERIWPPIDEVLISMIRELERVGNRPRWPGVI